MRYLVVNGKTGRIVKKFKDKSRANIMAKKLSGKKKVGFFVYRKLFN